MHGEIILPKAAVKIFRKKKIKLLNNFHLLQAREKHYCILKIGIQFSQEVKESY